MSQKWCRNQLPACIVICSNQISRKESNHIFRRSKVLNLRHMLRKLIPLVSLDALSFVCNVSLTLLVTLEYFTFLISPYCNIIPFKISAHPCYIWYPIWVPYSTLTFSVQILYPLTCTFCFDSRSCNHGSTPNQNNTNTYIKLMVRLIQMFRLLEFMTNRPQGTLPRLYQ